MNASLHRSKTTTAHVCLMPMLLSLLVVVCGCKDDESPLLDTSPIVTVVYSTDGLGDRSYVDKIYQGIEKAGLDNGLRIQHLMPYNLDETWRYLEQMLIEHDDGIRRLYIIAESGIEEQMDSFARRVSSNDMTQFLFLETRNTFPNIHTLFMPLYGVCYEAGALVQAMDDVDHVAIVKGNPHTKTLDYAVDGFKDGYGNEADKHMEVLHLSDGYGGFDMANDLYQTAYQLDINTDLVVPLCGGSAQGLYRYNREYPLSFYTIGLDADMSPYSPRVPFSCVKHIDRAMEECIKLWKENALPDHLSLGLEEGFTELVITPGYEPRLESKLRQVHQTAISKEHAYEKK
ncbi:MAG: BMP family ABC transporter substrate-binding protein [Prevotella sp.]|nr:BMP family ABC transporter substrate-binding protein [Prevotella sp.]